MGGGRPGSRWLIEDISFRHHCKLTPGKLTHSLQSERVALQWSAWEKQQKEIAKHQDIIQRLAGGAQSGRAAQAEKALERIKEEGVIEKPFIAKKRSFTFPTVRWRLRQWEGWS